MIFFGNEPTGPKLQNYGSINDYEKTCLFGLRPGNTQTSESAPLQRLAGIFEILREASWSYRTFQLDSDKQRRGPDCTVWFAPLLFEQCSKDGFSLGVVEYGSTRKHITLNLLFFFLIRISLYFSMPRCAQQHHFNKTIISLLALKERMLDRSSSSSVRTAFHTMGNARRLNC